MLGPEHSLQERSLRAYLKTGQLPPLLGRITKTAEVLPFSDKRHQWVSFEIGVQTSSDQESVGIERAGHPVPESSPRI
jgi:tRNA U55 pseudouridine synthase TruB